MKSILHLDMDAFFASCIQTVRKDFKNQCLLVANDYPHAVIVSCSYECRDYGVKAGMQLFEAKELLKNTKYNISTADMELFQNLSKKIKKIISGFTNKIEMSSIDECYIDITADLIDKYGDPKNIALLIKIICQNG